jgi:hypothetical protein
VTGAPYFTTLAQPVVWYTTSPMYFTDPGDLSATVNHTAADAIVAAAAGVWNIPTASLVLANGGELAEHVSSENVYLGANGPVFPADVSSANDATVQIAVIYDSDGSVTELLLGQGASDPENCLQNGVTESVDSITRAGLIQHALLILNGRCTGVAAEAQLQLQWQLMRAFGRVLGLGWSQTNDNVFTGTPQATYAEIMKWPIMHPIDVICGAYTYQCQPYPFTLRPDDIASLGQLYFMVKGQAPVGKVDTLANASAITGVLQFGDQQGMQGVNLKVRRHFPASDYFEDGPVLSAVSGYRFRWNNGNPVTGPAEDTVAGSMGDPNLSLEGAFNLSGIPELPMTELQDAYISVEAINPLYIGEYAIGPYTSAPVAPSGSAFVWRDNGIVPYESNYYVEPVPNSVAACGATGLGTRAEPTHAAASGWWMGVLCGYGATAWSGVTVQANRSLTVEVTALDEQGMSTELKLQPVVGAWQQSDPAGALPTVAATTMPFNSIAAGLTSLNFEPPSAGALRLAIADERGDGRPDYAFRARVLYADSLAPATITAGGGLIAIAGLGFRPGNQVTVDGVAATVVGSSANTILAVVPPFAVLPEGSALTADVAVVDGMSGGSSVIYGGLSYPSLSIGTQTKQVTALSPMVYVASGQRVSFTEQASLANAGAAAVGVPVSWSEKSGPMTFAAGDSDSDGNGIAAMGAVFGPLAGGSQAAGSACAWGSVCADFAASGVDPSKWALTALVGAGQSVAATGVLHPVVLQATDRSGHAVVGVPVEVYQTVTGYVACPPAGRCPIGELYQATRVTMVSDANGLIVVTPQQLAGEAEVTTIAASAGTQAFVSMPLTKKP